MKSIILILSFLTIISCKSQNEKILTNDVCNCISGISKGIEKTELNNKLQDCVADSYKKNTDEVNKIAKEYLRKNSNKTIIDAQNYVRNDMTEKLVKDCPKYNEITAVIFPVRELENKVVKVIADEICDGINELKIEKLSDEIVDPIIFKSSIKYDLQIREFYDFNNSAERKRFANDLVYELNTGCEKYKLFSIRKQN